MTDALAAGSFSAPELRDLLALAQRAVTERDQLRQLVEHIPAVLYIDEMTEPRTGAFPTIYVGPQIETVLGISQQEWIEGDDVWQEHMHPDDWPRVSQEYAEYLERGGVLVQEYRFIRPDDGRLVWVRDDCTMSLDPASGRRILLGVMFDVTGQKLLEAQLRAAEEQLQFRASHDPLTGLANRPLFDETLELALARARRNNLEVAVLFVDIDGFKRVNDAYGHDAGDEVLRIVANRLMSCARESDLVARRGGDEFLVLLPDIDPSSRGSVSSSYRGVEVADSITRRILDEMEETIDVTLQGREDATVTVSLSIGRCVYPWDAADATTMMAVADATMYAAKQDR